MDRAGDVQTIEAFNPSKITHFCAPLKLRVIFTIF